MPRAKSKRKKLIANTKRILSKFSGEAAEDVARTTATIARDSLSAVPYASGACGGLVAVLDHRKRVKDIKRDARDLLHNAVILADAVDMDKSVSDVSTSRAQAVKSLCDEIQLQVTPLTRASWGSRLLHLNRDEDLIKYYQRSLAEASQDFVVASTSKTEREVSKISRNQDSLIALNVQTRRDILEMSRKQSFLVVLNTQTQHEISEINTKINAIYTLSISPVPAVLF